MKGVLVIAHGSRVKETEATLTTVLDLVREKLPEVWIEHAFMEFNDRTIASGIAALAAKGVTEIKVAPYFLFMGVHMKEDIPNTVNECVKDYPGIKVVMGEPLGADIRLAEILADRIMN